MPQLNTVKPMRDDIPLTPASVELAQRAQAAERALATQETGIRFDGDRPYLPRPLPTYDPVTEAEQMRRVEALETLTTIVRAYGPQRVSTWIRNIADIEGMQA